MVDELIRRSDVIDAIYSRNEALLRHEQYRRKRGDIDLLGVIGNINTIPTIEAEPVLHGKWEVNTKTGKYRCSVCKTDEIVTPWGKPPFARCPTCGAKMDEV